jgi:structural maintenance of chromosome 1
MEADAATTEEKLKKIEKEIRKVDEALSNLNSLSGQSGQVDLDAAQLVEYQKLRQKSNEKTATLRAQLDKLKGSQHVDQEKLEQLDSTRKVLTARAKVRTFCRPVKINAAEANVLRVYLHQECQAVEDDQKEKMDKIAAMVQEHTKEQNVLKVELETLQNRNKDLLNKRKDISDQLEKKKEELRSCKESRRQSHQEDRMKEAIENMKRHFPGVLGRLDQLCKPLQTKYNIAVSTALGMHMQSIVVEDRKTGIKLYVFTTHLSCRFLSCNISCEDMKTDHTIIHSTRHGVHELPTKSTYRNLYIHSVRFHSSKTSP